MATPKRVCEIIGKGLKNPANICRAEIMDVAAYIAQLESENMHLHNIIVTFRRNVSDLLGGVKDGK